MLQRVSQKTVRRRVRLPRIAFIVARSNPGNVIGCENRLPWKISSDLRRFREITTGHAVVMGRKTYESIGRPLPNRENIVISRSASLNVPDVEITKSHEAATFLADLYSIINHREKFFVIGGAEIYKLFVDRFNLIYLTEVFSDNIEGDAHFDTSFDKRNWNLISEMDFPQSDRDQYPHRLSVFERRDKFVRAIDVSDFMTGVEKISPYLFEQYASEIEQSVQYLHEDEDQLSFFDKAL